MRLRVKRPKPYFDKKSKNVTGKTVVDPTICDTLSIFKKLPRVNYCPVGENPPHLVRPDLR
jgi:hypothetical protein